MNGDIQNMYGKFTCLGTNICICVCVCVLCVCARRCRSAGVQECRSAGLGVVCADAVAGADVGVLGVGV